MPTLPPQDKAPLQAVMMEHALCMTSSSSAGANKQIFNHYHFNQCESITVTAKEHEAVGTTTD